MKAKTIKLLTACYATQTAGHTSLRVQLNYTANDWLFINRATFNIDGRVVRFPRGGWQRDHGGGDIWEWVDIPVVGDDRRLLEQIAGSKKTTVRFQGRQYYADEVVRDSDKQLIRDMLLVEEILKGRN